MLTTQQQRYFHFFNQALQKIAETHGDEREIYRFLAEHQALLTVEEFRDIFPQWLQTYFMPFSKSTPLIVQEGDSIAPLTKGGWGDIRGVITQISLESLVKLGKCLITSDKGNKSVNRELATLIYESLFSYYCPNQFPEKWATLQMYLGVAYQKRILGNQAENKEASLTALEKALTVFTLEKFPEQWAETHCNLGVAYRNRILGNQAENKETSRTALQKALTVFTHEKFPQQWAEAQYNLGNTYRNRIQGDQAENKETSIQAYQKALAIFASEHYPVLYAVTEMKLGNAYRNRIRGEKADNLEDAIAAYRRALNFVNQEEFPTKWARIQMNLATAYSNRIQGEKEENLESAIEALNQALTVYTDQDFPQKWARIQARLGFTYTHRIQGEKEENLESAIEALNQALTIYTDQDFPIDWGKTQLFCGETYQEKYHQDKQPDTKAKAITAYQNALTVFTPDSHPPLCLRVATYLGNFALTEANWELTIEAYQKAITATEQLRNWATSDQRRQDIIKSAIDIYANLIHAYVQVGEAGKALEIADRSRAKHLVDLMSSNDLDRNAEGKVPEVVHQLLKEYQLKQQELSQLRDNDPENIQAISQLQEQLHQIWLQIRQADSVLAKQIQVTPLSLSQMQGLLSPTTALISFFTTPYHTHLFILRNNAPAEVFTCTGENRETFQHWLRDHWLLPYAEINESEEREAKFQHWKEQMPSFLAELSQRLQLNQLVTHHLQNINELIIIPHLYLHQIPFAALPVQDSYLGDQFTLRIAPSCQILDFCFQRQQLTPQALGVIENASNDLIFSTYEVEQITQLYQLPTQRLTGEQATLKNYKQLTQNVQILHSSHHAQVQLTQPLDSSLKLADGEIYLRDLLLPSWRRPELLEVFLSCCETQLGKVEMTDDLLSLSAGFLIAGARAVLSTLWQIEDHPTALLAIFYYESRREGISRAAALQQAQKRLREMSKEEFSVYGESMKRHLEAQAQAIKHKSEELAQASKQARREGKKELEKQLKAEKKRLFFQQDQPYERAIKEIKQLMREGENKPFSHPYHWSSVVCQGL